MSSWPPEPREERAGEASNISARTLARWRAEGGGDDRRAGPGAPPAQKLSEEERQRVLDTANSVAYRELSPRQLVPLLADPANGHPGGMMIFRTTPLTRTATVVDNSVRRFKGRLVT